MIALVSCNHQNSLAHQSIQREIECFYTSAALHWFYFSILITRKALLLIKTKILFHQPGTCMLLIHNSLVVLSNSFILFILMLLFFSNYCIFHYVFLLAKQLFILLEISDT